MKLCYSGYNFYNSISKPGVSQSSFIVWEERLFLPWEYYLNLLLVNDGNSWQSWKLVKAQDDLPELRHAAD